ncbi:MAG: phosphoglycerate kinase [Candidatus Bathyarchaeota archaeon]|jgi:phosphoglycerate kinase
MAFNFLGLDDVDVSGKTVFLRVDINSPLDPVSKRILDATRIKATLDTLHDLRDARVVLGAHQSRPGKYDFTSLELHTRVLQSYLNSGVKFVDDVLGERALAAIKGLGVGEVLVLDNLRFIDEENKQGPPAEVVETGLVEGLSPFFDLVVNDAFAAAHRSQPSLVGFGELMPMVAGRLMEKELNAIDRVLSDPARPCVFILGGVKVEDRIPVIGRVLRDGIADRVLIGGLVRDVFHLSERGSSSNLGSMSGVGMGLVEEAKRLMDEFGDLIEMPVDVALDVKGERVEIGVDSLMDERNVFDIGLNTLARFSEVIKGAGTVVAEGPLGMFERRHFNTGTKEVLRAMAGCGGFTLVGGGHLGGLASMMDLDWRMGHVSTGGGAMLALLAGEPMPVIEALERAKMRGV